MKRYTTDNLEELLKEKTEQYLMYPSERVWKQIQKRIQPSQTFTILSASLCFFIAASISVFFNEQKIAHFETPSGQLAFQMKEKSWEQTLPPVWISNNNHQNDKTAEIETHNIVKQLSDIQKDDQFLPKHPLQEQIQIPIGVEKALQFKSSIQPKERKIRIIESLSNVFEKAKQISKAATWQIYFGPNMGYRTLRGLSSSMSYQYNSYAYNTTSLFARNVKDAVIHRPGIGFEIGTAMYYPLTKKLSIKAGLQANYHHYQIDANRGLPEIATFGMNNLGYTSYPINAVSDFRNGMPITSSITLQNERFMISMPMGFDYKVLGNKKMNFSLASTIQPTYVLNSSAYLISTNLKNYAKAPSLNRRWNVNTGLEANLNFQKGSFKWTLSPQFRYQMLHSFTEKYPIKENLYDFGIRFGIMKTLN